MPPSSGLSFARIAAHRLLGAPFFGISESTIVPRPATSIPDNSVQVSPYTIERLRHHLGVAQCFGQQFRPPFKYDLRDCERLIRAALRPSARNTPGNRAR